MNASIKSCSQDGKGSRMEGEIEWCSSKGSKNGWMGDVLDQVRVRKSS